MPAVDRATVPAGFEASSASVHVSDFADAFLTVFRDDVATVVNPDVAVVSAGGVVPAAGVFAPSYARPFSIPFCWFPCLFRFFGAISLSYNFNLRITAGVRRCLAVKTVAPLRCRSRAVSHFGKVH